MVTVKSVNAQSFLHQFVISNRDLKETRKRGDLNKKDGLDLINRARILMRSDKINKSDLAKITEVITDYKNKCIMLSDLRKSILGFEKKLGKN